MVEMHLGELGGQGVQFFAALVGALPESAMVIDQRMEIVYVNEAFTGMTGYSASEVVGRACSLLHGPATDVPSLQALSEAVERRAPFRGRLLNYRKDGSPFWNELAIAPVVTASGELSHFVGLHRDVTEAVSSRSELLSVLRETEHERATSTALLDIARSLAQDISTSAVVRAVSDAIPNLCDADRSAVALWDPETSRLSVVGHSGWTADLGDDLSRVSVSPSVSPQLAEIVAIREPLLIDSSTESSWAKAALARFEIAAYVAMPVRTATTLRGLLLAYWAESPAPAELEPTLRARLSGLAGLTAVALENAQLLEETHWAAAHDPLTGLPNRTTLELRLAHELQQAHDRGPTAVVFCDVDGLKRMNDSFGHAAGDRVLCEVAQRMRAAIRSGDTVSRVGGDEFVIVLSQVRGETEVQAILRRIEAALDTPVEVEGRLLAVRLSMGLAFSSEPLLQLPPRVAGNALIRAADLAMYQRKNRKDIPLSDMPLGRLQTLSADLPGALQRAEMSVEYQPQVDLSTGAVVAVEALARWVHPTLGLVGPHEFIPIAEMIGEMSAIGRFILDTACTDIAAVRRTHPDFALAVNVSNDELDLPGFVARVRDTLVASTLPASALSVEITESKLPADRVTALDQLSQLQAMGVGISLDDFGTGYTSLLQLRDLPVTELKVDRSYVEHVPSAGTDVLAGIVGLAHGLHLRAVAEGVSDEDQLLRARTAGFDRAQGYLLGHPMSATALAAHLDGAKRGTHGE